MKPHALLDIKDDSRLCSLVSNAIDDYHGGISDASIQSEYERIVTLTWLTCGIIGNGGFNYLIQQRLRGDPQYQLMEAAHRRIGCHISAEAFSEFLDLFPNRLPPFEMPEKFALYNAVPEKVRKDIDWKYLKEYDVLDSKLASFIRENRAQYMHLSEKVTPEPAPEDEKSVLEGLREMLAMVGDDPKDEDLRKLLLKRIEECERESNSSA